VIKSEAVIVTPEFDVFIAYSETIFNMKSDGGYDSSTGEITHRRAASGKLDTIPGSTNTTNSSAYVTSRSASVSRDSREDNPGSPLIPSLDASPKIGPTDQVVPKKRSSFRSSLSSLSSSLTNSIFPLFGSSAVDQSTPPMQQYTEPSNRLRSDTQRNSIGMESLTLSDGNVVGEQGDNRAARGSSASRSRSLRYIYIYIYISYLYSYAILTLVNACMCMYTALQLERFRLLYHR
jgi:hypothetical protein